MNNISSLYNSMENWNSLANRFLNGSNQLSELPIPIIDYSTPENHKSDQGYYGALVSSVSSGTSNTPLDLETIQKWYTLILEEMVTHHTIPKEMLDTNLNENEITEFLKKFQDQLIVLKKDPKEENIVSFLGELCCEIESRKMFGPINRRIAHLFLCYVVSNFKCPLIIFTAKDQNDYLSSINSELKMKLMLANKVRDAVIVDGKLLHKVGGKYGNDWYKSEESTSKRDLTIEWHRLHKAKKQWEEKLSENDG